MDFDYVKIIITVVVAVIGWVIANYYTQKRDTKNKRREIRLNHLINAYIILTHEITERDVYPERDNKIEKLVSEIQLFGTKEQINLVKILTDQICNKEIMNLDPLINSLRNDLRKELELENINDNVRWVRYSKD